MNPILLKPSGGIGCPGDRARPRRGALRRRATTSAISIGCGASSPTTLDGWRTRCDVLVMEGAGSPVELKLMERDLSNLRPVRHLDGRWVLVGDIDRGGIYAQLAGTWALLPADGPRARARSHRQPVPRRHPAVPRSAILAGAARAGLCRCWGPCRFAATCSRRRRTAWPRPTRIAAAATLLAWVRLPHAANLTDCQPWWDDAGVRVRWTDYPGRAGRGRRDRAAWLEKHHRRPALAARARARPRRSAPAAARGGARGRAFAAATRCWASACAIRRVWRAMPATSPGLACCRSARSSMPPRPCAKPRPNATAGGGRPTKSTWAKRRHRAPARRCTQVWNDGLPRPEGVTPRPGLGHLPAWLVRIAAAARALAAAAGFTAYRAHPVPWAEQRRSLYAAMADHVAAHVDLDPVRRYLGI